MAAYYINLDSSADAPFWSTNQLPSSPATHVLVITAATDVVAWNTSAFVEENLSIESTTDVVSWV